MNGKRILFVGISCSGKTTLGRQLSQQLVIPQLDLDDITWLPNWIMRPRPEAKQVLQKFVNEKSSWIISGNYTDISLDVTWPLATHVIWLHYPLRIILYRYFTRTFNRIVTRKPVCNGNYESLYNSFFAEEPLLPWILKNHKKQNERFSQYRNEQFKDKQWIEITNTDQLNKLISKL